jgi:hypothetical protein
MAQSGHAISQYFLDYPELAREWNNNYLISLSIDSEQELLSLLHKLTNHEINVSHFCEPDMNHELTSICFIETKVTRKFTHKLKLSLNN